MNRYLVNISVWIDFFRQRKTSGVDEFYRILDHSQYYGITELIYQEVIQGALNEKDFASLADYLAAQTFSILSIILKPIGKQHKFISPVAGKV
jgi:hypothetical protein